MHVSICVYVYHNRGIIEKEHFKPRLVLLLDNSIKTGEDEITRCFCQGFPDIKWHLGNCLSTFQELAKSGYNQSGLHWFQKQLN